mmetsp:Transcript_32394/g.103288  ORF Transcript_32394/g.103288 Transcript_32394/m.103288 type:complete len:213 (+) Transcript_32394:1111-1749(+)
MAAQWRISGFKLSSRFWMRTAVKVLRTTSGGTHLERSSKSLSRTSSNLFGVCSEVIELARSVMYFSHSGGSMVILSSFFSKEGPLILHDSKVRMARRTFLFENFAIRAANFGLNSKRSFSATENKTSTTSFSVGAGTRMPRHRDRTGSMTFDGFSQQRINRQLVVHFSIVLRNAACACFVRRSTSTKTTTLKGIFDDDDVMVPALAISLMIS